MKGWEVRGSTPVAAKFWSSLTSWATSVLAEREMSAMRVERTETIMLVSPRATTNSIQATMRSRAGTEGPETGSPASGGGDEGTVVISISPLASRGQVDRAGLRGRAGDDGHELGGQRQRHRDEHEQSQGEDAA